MFDRILIANRGEIALRVLRACKALGVDTVCVYSEADREAIYLRYADETICIGPGPAGSSYLDIPRIISAAEIADVEAIHPGYGFLSENEHFAEVCRSCGIVFIGPPTDAIANMGNKSIARHIEIQLIGDRHGNLVHLGERDCSIQRRHQKLIEEAPSPFVDDELRAKMGAAAVAIARAAKYENAGTIEFLVDKDRNFYFME